MATKSRALEVTVISGEGLRGDRSRVARKNTYVSVRIDSMNFRTTRMTNSGGSYPAWNEKLSVEMPIHARFLMVEVRSRFNSGDRVVGTARIPVSDFAGCHVPENYLHFLSYRLRDGSGERNGIINLSVRMKLPEINADPAIYAASAVSCSQSWLGVPAADKVATSASEIVTGVPFWYKY